MWSILLVEKVAWATSSDPVGHQFPPKKYWPMFAYNRVTQRNLPAGWIDLRKFAKVHYVSETCAGPDSPDV
jgi:hypothetical protein